MKAVLFDSFGGPEVLRVGDVDEPHAGPGEVRVTVMAAGVNALDWKIRSGFSPFPVDLPFVGGLEVSGVVDEVGDGVEGVSVGDAVFGPTQRGLAEYAVLSTFAVKPASMSWTVAAALPVAVETASRTLGQLGLAAGQTLLVNGAAGSVGSAAVQLAVAAGAVVIGTASEKNHDLLRSLGCTPVAYGDGMVERVRAVATDGVDVALDCAGQGALGDLVALTGDPARVITIADPSAREHGVVFSAGGPNQGPASLERVAALVVDDRFAVPLGQTFPFAEVAAAQQVSQTGHAGGKLVILIGDESA